MVDVSIIIINYNTKELVQQCIDSIFSNTEGISFEVIIVDNASTDHSHEYFSTNEKILFIRSQQNLGFGKASNRALEIARGRNILFLNPDTVLLNNAIQILSDYLNVHPEVGACGGNLFDGEGQPAYSHLLYFPSIFGELDRVFHYRLSRIVFGKNVYFNFTSKPLPVKYITGADMMVRKDILDKLKGFDPDFFMYYEDTELGYRINKSGYIILNIPQARIVHLEGKSFEFSERRERMIFSGRSVFYSKVYSKSYFKTANFLYYIYVILAIFFSLFLNQQKKREKYIKRLKIFKEVNKDSHVV